MHRKRRGGCRLIDTPLVARDTRVRPIFAALLLGLLALPSCASAQLRDLKATVVWVRKDRVYLAAEDSLALEPGELLAFLDRGKTVATGEVTRVVDRELAIARLISGSLARVKKPGRLQVRGEPPRLRALPLLRVGYPGAARANLLFACGGMTLDSNSATRGYRTDVVTDHSFRLVHGPETWSAAPWPDTLLIRLFDEPADEEIALERGELDAGVFWPGELSVHMREEPRWHRPLLGRKSRGVLVAIETGESGEPGPDAPRDSSAATSDSLAFAALNREMFRSDLAPWTGAPDSLPDLRRRGAAHYVVDPSCPGQRVLERFLNRGAKPPAAGRVTRAVHVAYLDAVIGSADSLALGIAAYLRHGAFTSDPGAHAGSTRARTIFAMGCPLVCDPELRPRLSALGADALVNLLACPPAERAP